MRITKIIKHGDSIALLILAIITTILGSIGYIPASYLLTIILSLLTLMAFSYLRQVLRIEQVYTLIKGVNSEFSVLRSSIGFEHTQSSDENWRKAVMILNPVEKGYVVYDTSSYCNIEKYEDCIIKGAKEGALFTRLVCFTSEKNDEMKDWFLTMISSKYDKSGKYEELRKAMKIGNANVWHYPFELSSDYLITERNGDPQGAIIGFCTTEDIKKRFAYSAGIYITSKEACKNLIELYNMLLSRAKEHPAEQENKKPEERCFCYDYYNQKARRLFPE